MSEKCIGNYYNCPYSCKSECLELYSIDGTSPKGIYDTSKNISPNTESGVDQGVLHFCNPKNREYTKPYFNKDIKEAIKQKQGR